MDTKTILLGHGSGGVLSHRLIEEIFIPAFKNSTLQRQEDSAIIDIGNQEIAFTTDSYVVDPIFFPGGDIGKLAICGTINDLAVMGATPKYISVGFILEEGFSLRELQLLLNSMAATADEAGVQVVTGDTKVVPRGAVDKIFINTSGIGIFEYDRLALAADSARPGDVVIVNGTIADHGVAVMAQREGLELETGVTSDVAPLNELIAQMLDAIPDIRLLRDPTRGGLATTLNEIAKQSAVGIKLYESHIPFSEAVRSACEILGLDPLYLANEGKCIVICPAGKADQLLSVMRKHRYGKSSCTIGEIQDVPEKRVYLETFVGGQRIVDMLSGEQFPRIC